MEMSYKYFYYLKTEDGLSTIVRIKTKRKPSASTRPVSGLWAINELRDGKFVMPCYPEVTWGTLADLEFIGKQKIGEPR